MVPRPVVDAAGRLHVAFRGANVPGLFNSPGTIMHSMWDTGAWTTPVTVSTNSSFTDPAIGVAPNGRLIATWGEAKLSAAGIEPKTFASFWSPLCARK
jgi:hypothetical protein